MRWSNELKDILFLICLIFFIRSTIVNWYFIPSDSMMPTLVVGDQIVVNKLSYGLMLPFTDKQVLSWSLPSRGDLVVFESPKSEGKQTQIKRIVGVPGDVVSFQHGILTINGQPAKEIIQTQTDPAQENDLIKEMGIGHKPYEIFRHHNGGMTFYETQSWEIPNGKFFCLGDNRDNAYDSRFWGFIDQKSIYGKAFLILYSTKSDASWFPYFEKNRWFKKI